jgi:hypothetical protein
MGGIARRWFTPVLTKCSPRRTAFSLRRFAFGKVFLSWHIGAIAPTSDSVTNSRAVRKHCSLTTINTRHHSTRKEVQVPPFPCSAHFLITAPFSLLRAVHPEQDIKHMERVLELCPFAAVQPRSLQKRSITGMPILRENPSWTRFFQAACW